MSCWHPDWSGRLSFSRPSGARGTQATRHSAAVAAETAELAALETFDTVQIGTASSWLLPVEHIKRETHEPMLQSITTECGRQGLLTGDGLTAVRPLKWEGVFRLGSTVCQKWILHAEAIVYMNHYWTGTMLICLCLKVVKWALNFEAKMPRCHLTGVDLGTYLLDQSWINCILGYFP